MKISWSSEIPHYGGLQREFGFPVAWDILEIIQNFSFKLHRWHRKTLPILKNTVLEFISWISLKTASHLSVQLSLSCVQCFVTPCPAACQSSNHQLPELTQIHVHRVGDAIQPFHPLFSPFPPSFNFSQHQGLFQWVSSFHQVAKVLEFHLQHQSFHWIFRTDIL